MIALFQSPNFSGLQCNPRRSPATEKDWRFSPLTSRVFNVTRHQNFIMAGKSMFQSPSFSGLQCNKWRVGYCWMFHSCFSPLASRVFNVTVKNTLQPIITNCFSPLASRVFNVTTSSQMRRYTLACFSPLASRVFNVTKAYLTLLLLVLSRFSPLASRVFNVTKTKRLFGFRRSMVSVP